MNTLEYIDKQILFVKQNIQYHKDLLTTADDEYIEIIKSTIRLLEPDLQTLQQIKSELEAWYVVKPKIEIKEIEDNGVLSKGFYRKYWTCNEYGVRDKEQVEKIEKALEVKDE